MPAALPDSPERLYAPSEISPITKSDGGRLDAVAATVADGLGITYTAVTPGTDGNNLTVDVTDSAGAAISVSAASTDITVSAPIAGKAATLILDAGAGEVVTTADAVGSEFNGINVSLIKRVTISSLALSVEAVGPRDFKVYLATDATTDVFATLATALTGSNNDLTYTSVLEGAYGNLISVAYLNPGAPSQALRVEVDGKAIRVYLATGAGTKQVETATAAGTITTAGNASVVTTGAFITGSPITTTFAVALDDTAALWAEKARIALINDRRVSSFVDISGTTTAIIGTRKDAAANDATFNFALADVTSAGITEAASSANTTAGVLYAITSTAALVEAAIEANADAAALVTVANTAANDGTGVVTALAATNLASGVHANATSTVAQVVTALNANATYAALATATGTGTTSTVINANYSGTTAGGIDAGSVTLGEIVGAINTDADSKDLIRATVDPKNSEIQPTAAAWASSAYGVALAGGLAGQWDLTNGFARGIYVETAGDVVFYIGDPAGTREERTVELPANGILDIAFTGIKSTGTTATGIFGRA